MEQDIIEQAAREYQKTLPYCGDPKIRGMYVGALDGFKAGVKWYRDYLANIPWNEAINEIARKETKNNNE